MNSYPRHFLRLSSLSLDHLPSAYSDGSDLLPTYSIRRVVGRILRERGYAFVARCARCKTVEIDLSAAAAVDREMQRFISQCVLIPKAEVRKIAGHR